MDDLLLEERIRYPPFESYRFQPELLPIGVARTEISNQITRDEANKIVSEMPPPFRIGDKKSWLVERRYIYQGKTLKLDKTHNQEMSEAVPKDSVIHKQRTGWYLTPNLIHSQARKIMNFSVIILLIALCYLFFEPILSIWGIPSIGTGRVRFGLLDYPLLAVIVVPILFIPIMMRVGANFSDLIKQRRFLTSPPPEPKIKFHSDTTSGENLVVEIAAHTDDVGQEKDNLILSESRANAVRDYLISRGVLGQQLIAKGYGEAQPIVPNTSEENRSLNRRVEIFIRIIN